MECKSSIAIFPYCPSGFAPKVHVASCYVNVDSDLLFLQHNAQSKEPQKWTVPAGKVEGKEKVVDAAHRELKEETGITLSSSKELVFIGTLFIRKPNLDYTYHLFQVKFDKHPPISLSEEHDHFCWATIQKALTMPLMLGGIETLHYYVKCTEKETQLSPKITVYLLLEKSDYSFLLLRNKTGYFANQYGLLSSQVKIGESATTTIIREAFITANIEIQPNHLHLSHVAHRWTTQWNIDLFFTCQSWKGEICNKDPNRYQSIDFFPQHSLPFPMAENVAQAIQSRSQDNLYTKYNWGESYD